MPVPPLSLALVVAQLALIAAILLPWGAPGFSRWGLLPITAGVALGVWALAANRPPNFSVFPEPRARAHLVTTGPYRFVRHPMYLAVLLAGGGCALGWRGTTHLVVFAALAGVLHVKAAREERLLARRFPAYADYAARTARIVPGLR